MSLHLLVVAALVAAAIGKDGREAKPMDAGRAPAIEVVLLSRAGRQAGVERETIRSLSPARSARQVADLAPIRAKPEVTDVPTPATAAPAIPASAPASGAGAAAPASMIDPALGEDYRRRLLEHIAAYRRPPALAPGERSSGIVLIQLAIDRGGDVLSVAIAASSGVADLDDEAVATIWRARPLPPIPVALPARLAVTLPVSFEPERRAGVGGG